MPKNAYSVSLVNSARHLGKLNYLRADGKGLKASPLEISPRLYADRWAP